jgi:hypothetical protein
LCFLQESNDVPPQPRTCARQARTLSSDGQILTRESGCDDSPVWNKSNCSKVIAGHLCYVMELVGVGEVPLADFRGGLVDFDCGDGAGAGPFKRQRETTDPVEQRHQSQGHQMTPPWSSRSTHSRRRNTGVVNGSCPERTLHPQR